MRVLQKDIAVTSKPSLREREKELQSQLPTVDGLARLQELVRQYGNDSGRTFLPGTSLITFILVHERERGMITP